MPQLESAQTEQTTAAVKDIHKVSHSSYPLKTSTNDNREGTADQPLLISDDVQLQTAITQFTKSVPNTASNDILSQQHESVFNATGVHKATPLTQPPLETPSTSTRSTIDSAEASTTITLNTSATSIMSGNTSASSHQRNAEDVRIPRTERQNPTNTGRTASNQNPPPPSTGQSTSDSSNIPKLQLVPFTGDPDFYNRNVLLFEFHSSCTQYLKEVPRIQAKVTKLINALRLGRIDEYKIMHALAALAPNDKQFHRYLERRLLMLYSYITPRSLGEAAKNITPSVRLPHPADLAPGQEKPQKSCLTCSHRKVPCEGSSVQDGKCQPCIDAGTEVLCYWYDPSHEIETFDDALDFYGHMSTAETKKRSLEIDLGEETEGNELQPPSKKRRIAKNGQIPSSSRSHTQRQAKICVLFGKRYPIDLEYARTDNDQVHPGRCYKSLFVQLNTSKGVDSKSLMVDPAPFKHLRQAIEFTAFEYVIRKQKVREFTYEPQYTFRYKYPGNEWRQIAEEDWVDFDTYLRNGSFPRHRLSFNCFLSPPSTTATKKGP